MSKRKGRRPTQTYTVVVDGTHDEERIVAWLVRMMERIKPEDRPAPTQKEETEAPGDAAESRQDE